MNWSPLGGITFVLPVNGLALLMRLDILEKECPVHYVAILD